MLAVYLPHSSAENHDAHTSSTNSCLLSSTKFCPVQWSIEWQDFFYQVERFKRIEMSSLKCRPAPRSSLVACRRLHGVTIPAKLRKRSSASSTARRFLSTPEPPSCRFVPCLTSYSIGELAKQLVARSLECNVDQTHFYYSELQLRVSWLLECGQKRLSEMRQLRLEGEGGQCD